jgi:hypothetical protein
MVFVLAFGQRKVFDSAVVFDRDYITLFTKRLFFETFFYFLRIRKHEHKERN